jgi:SPP1 family predicted phage head-tail adaptor
MRSGTLNRLIDIEDLTVTTDGMGSSVESWSTYKSNVWAAIWPVSAKERIQAGKQELEITHRIRIRYISGITADMRIKYGTAYFNIISIINVGTEDRMIDILATEEQ